MAKPTTEKKEKKDNRLVRYFKGVRAEMSKMTWPTRQGTLRLTAIVLGVTAAMSIALGLIDWVFARVFALMLG